MFCRGISVQVLHTPLRITPLLLWFHFHSGVWHFGCWSSVFSSGKMASLCVLVYAQALVSRKNKILAALISH